MEKHYTDWCSASAVQLASTELVTRLAVLSGPLPFVRELISVGGVRAGDLVRAGKSDFAPPSDIQSCLLSPGLLPVDAFPSSAFFLAYLFASHSSFH